MVICGVRMYIYGVRAYNLVYGCLLQCTGDCSTPYLATSLSGDT